MIKILVVDDDEMTRYYLKKLILKKFGYHVNEACNGFEALERLNEEMPDVIFLDISMPVMNGIEFLREIRRTPQFESLSVIVMTAHSDRNTVNELFQLGIQDYILKPFGHFKTFERLREILTEVQNKRKSQKNEEEEKFINKSKLIIASPDSSFRSFVSQLLSQKYKVLEASDEKTLISITKNTNPEIIILSDEFRAMNKISLLNALHETETDHKILIYLCTSVIAKGNNSLYQGVLHKTFIIDEFMMQFYKSVLKFNSLFEMIQSDFEESIKKEIKNSIKKSLALKDGKKIEIMKRIDFDTLSEMTFCQTHLNSVKENFRFDIALASHESDAKEVVLEMKETMSAENPYIEDHPNLRFITGSISERLKINLEKYGILTSTAETEVKTIYLNSFLNNWKLIIPFKYSENKYFVVGVNLSKLSNDAKVEQPGKVNVNS